MKVLRVVALLTLLCWSSVSVLVAAAERFSLGSFLLTVRIQRPFIEVLHNDRGVAWRTASEEPFLRAGHATLPQPPILDGNFQMEENIDLTTSWQTIESVTLVGGGRGLGQAAVVITGLVGDGEANVSLQYNITISESLLSTNQLQFDMKILKDNENISSMNRLFLSYWSDERETFHGFGESFTDFDMSGRRIPILVSEQGVGRGTEPITSVFNKVAEGTGGHWYTTYCPKPLYLTSFNRSVIFDNSEVMYIDLTRKGFVEAEVWSLSIRGNILVGASMKEVVSEITLVTGRMKRPPAWTQQGAILGLEGGTKEVMEHVDLLKSGGVPVVGVWLQDWVGLRHSYDGDRLIWNWEVNYDWYPGWQDMVSTWRENNTRVLTYLNPFFSDPEGYTNQSRNNFYREGIEKGYFVLQRDGSPYVMNSISIKFCMLDLTNPEAVTWMKRIIKEYSMDEAMSSGWMADFGEYLPFDAVLHSGEDAASYHNRYPEDWAKLTFEVLQENGRDNDVLYFMRSAWLRSPKYNSVFWEGDQLVNWDADDGLQSVILGALSGGISGHTITHSDIGGYTVTKYPVPGCTYMRTEELLNRWTELTAFGAGLFRTHIGSSTSSENFNVYDSPETIAHFAKFAGIFAALKPYRDGLIKDAVELGLPLMRPMAINYAYDSTVWTIQDQYLYGDDFLVAPMLEEGSTFRSVYFPAFSGIWVYLWCDTCDVIIDSSHSSGINVQVSADIGFPPVYFKKYSPSGLSLQRYLSELGFTNSDKC